MNPAVKILIASGQSEMGPARRTLDQKAKGFIRKPFDAGEMLSVVREILDRT